MSAAQIGPGFGTSPGWLPHALDVPSDRVMLVRRSEADYRAAGFLDDRSLTPETPRAILGWEEMEAALSPGARRDAQFIFHIGHVGSTLIARLLGELPEVLSLREPALLRLFHQLLQPGSAWPPETARKRLGTFVSLLSRTYAPEQRAIVKATSFTSEIAHETVPQGSKALLLYVTQRSYIENILAGDASRHELGMLSPSRAERLAARTGLEWKTSGLGEQAALAWACEIASLAAAGEALGADRAMWCDFDRFLAAPAETLGQIASFFGHALAPQRAMELVRGPLMRRYSKDLDYEYTPELRREVLAQSRSENAADIAAALRWLDRAAAASPIIAECLKRSA